MKRKISISGVNFHFDKSIKEIGPMIVREIKDKQESLDKITGQYSDLKKKVGMFRTQIDSLTLYVKDMFPELAKDLNIKTQAAANK